MLPLTAITVLRNSHSGSPGGLSGLKFIQQNHMLELLAEGW